MKKQGLNGYHHLLPGLRPKESEEKYKLSSAAADIKDALKKGGSEADINRILGSPEYRLTIAEVVTVMENVKAFFFADRTNLGGWYDIGRPPSA